MAVNTKIQEFAEKETEILSEFLLWVETYEENGGSFPENFIGLNEKYIDFRAKYVSISECYCDEK